ncbi:apolipoprotein N-acyltransferase [Vibrio profundum]|uniref:apolipoprotein N-acyltransferase n=1 Tax=Vibrio profundum TaxID=2910247 RepID=UPI003D0D71CC
MIQRITHLFARPLAAALVGASTTLAFAPYHLWPIAVISPILLLLLIHQRSPKQALGIGYAWGFGQFTTGVSWVYVSIATFGGMPLIANLFVMGLLIAYLAIYTGLFTWSLNKFFSAPNLSRFLLAAPALWLVTDWLRGWVMTGFPWLWLGYSQIDSPLASFAPIGGVELITLALVLSSGAIALAILSKRWSLVLIPAVIFSLGFGLRNINWVTPDPASQTTLALVQGNIDQAHKWIPDQRWPIIDKYTVLTEKNWGSDIVIWPEAAIPAIEYDIRPFLKGLDAAARKHDSSIITGIIDQSKSGKFYNSILTVGDTENGAYHYDPAQRYHKHHLLPFGEFVPFESLLRPMAKLFDLPMSSFSRGPYIQPNLVANGRYFAAALCYEIIFGNQVRENVTKKTNFILTLSNDAWFGHSIGPVQHMQIARMRALELGKPLIRSTNNGITAVTDFKGKIIKKLPSFTTGVLKTTITSTKGETPYWYVGPYPLYLLAGVFLVLARRWQKIRR